MLKLLFKGGLILCLLFIILSFFLPAENKQGNKDNSIGLLATAAAVGSFFHDMDSFCQRNPQSCATGKSFFGLMAEKAQKGGVFFYQWLGSGLHKGAENTEQYLAEPGETPAEADSAATAPAAKTAEKTAPPPVKAAALIKPAERGSSRRPAPAQPKTAAQKPGKKAGSKPAAKTPLPREKRP